MYEQEGWRIIKAQDTLPPKLRVLRVVDCASATPLLRLRQLRELSIGQHCHMPVAELEQLSVLTQLEAVKLGYDIWRGGLGEREVEKGSAGWGFVPALKELELHDMRIDPGCDLLMHLAGLSSLTRLVWDRTYLCPDMFPFEIPEFITTYGDGGMGALGDALPKTLRVIEFGQFVPSIPEDSDADGDDSDSDDSSYRGKLTEGGVIYGLKWLQQSIAALGA